MVALSVARRRAMAAPTMPRCPATRTLTPRSSKQTGGCESVAGVETLKAMAVEPQMQRR